MEKIIINNMGNIVSLDTETNAVISSDFYQNRIVAYCKVRSNGQVITEDEVIDVNAGDVVLSATRWSEEEERTIVKPIVVHDPTACYDIIEIEKANDRNKEIRVLKSKKKLS